jgi:predicted DNA-binding transcriptional regulator AlpA
MIHERIEIQTDDIRSKREVARQLDIAERSVDRLIAEGFLPVISISPRRVGILQSDVDAFKRSRRVFRGVQVAA